MVVDLVGFKKTRNVEPNNKLMAMLLNLQAAISEIFSGTFTRCFAHKTLEFVFILAKTKDLSSFLRDEEGNRMIYSFYGTFSGIFFNASFIHLFQLLA